MFSKPGELNIPCLTGSPFLIARGGSFAHPPNELLVNLSKGKPVEIFGIDRKADRIAMLWPHYTNKILRQGRGYQVLAAVNPTEIATARELLANAHTQGAASHGMLVSLYEDRDDGTRALLGAAQLGEYFHTHFPGRAAFGRPILGRRYSVMGRGEVIKTLPITAAKRFAIADECRGRSLGDILACEALIVAANFRWPPARVVEVSRHMSGKRFFNECHGTSRDFLSRSGYVPVPLAKWVRKGALDQKIADELTDRIVPGYYYADLSNAKRPASVQRALKELR